jgi:homoserine kinase
VDAVSVSVPASSANLGPGYDCLGVALPLRNELVVERRGGALRVELHGEGEDVLPRDRDNLAVRAFAQVWEGPLDGLSFAMRNRVPLQSGTGSSSAAIVAGIAAALALSARPCGGRDVLPHAAALEGHPDNVAAASLGGFTVAIGGEPPLARRIAPPAGLGFVLAVPVERLCTTESRKALRAEVPRADAVFSLQRTALLVAALSSGELDVLPRALEDRLHQPDRERLTPLFSRLRALGDELGCYGVTLSGAGPSVLVWAPIARLEAIAAAIGEHAPDARVDALAPDPQGLIVA